MNPRSLFGGEFFSVVGDYLRKNFYWCIFYGFALQCLGAIYKICGYPLLIVFGLIYFAGTALLLLGFYFYVKSRHRHSLWCLFALLSMIGWVVLVLLKDKNPLPLSKEDA
jgi:hypothetical protein